MARRATEVSLGPEEKRTLIEWTRQAEHQKLIAERARIVLLAAERHSSLEIAAALGVRPARVSKWRKRFADYGVRGLETAERPGKPRRYDQTLDARILSLVYQPPPEPHLIWTGPLLAQSVGQVSLDHVWRVLRARGISLRRRDPSDFETSPAVMRNLVSIIGMYLSPTVSGFLVGIAAAESASPGERLRTYWRAPTPETVMDLARDLGGAPRLSLLETLKWATARNMLSTRTPRETRTFDAFLREAGGTSETLQIRAFSVGSHPPAYPGVHLHRMPTLDVWKEQLGVWLAVSLSGRPEDDDLIRDLLVAVGEYIGTQRIAFEWHAWPSLAGHAPPQPRKSA
jgi:transposase